MKEIVKILFYFLIFPFFAPLGIIMLFLGLDNLENWKKDFWGSFVALLGRFFYIGLYLLIIAIISYLIFGYNNY